MNKKDFLDSLLKRIDVLVTIPIFERENELGGRLCRVNIRKIREGSIRETLAAHALALGNGYLEIERDSRGEVVELRFIHPSHVRICSENVLI